MRSRLLLLVFLYVFGCAGWTAWADQAHLKDGSLIVGAVRGVAEGALRIETSFGGELRLPLDHVVGLTTDGPVVVQRTTGDTITGTLALAEGAQTLRDAGGKSVPLALAEVAGIWPEGQEPAAAAPVPGSPTAEGAPAPATPRAEWNGRAELGVNGQSGNKERVDVRANVDLNRKTDQTRLNVYVKGQYAETSSERSANEVMGGTRLEWDISDRTYAFGKVDLEYDEFEDLDLRATLTTGFGHYFIKREKLELKGWVGAGYEHEVFQPEDPVPVPAAATLEDAISEAIRREIARQLGEKAPDRTMNEAVVELGYAFRKDLRENFRFKHGLTYYPSIDDPTRDYRLAADTSFEFPLGKEPDWTLRTGVRHEYDALPQLGVDELDTTYFLNLGYNW